MGYTYTTYVQLFCTTRSFKAAEQHKSNEIKLPSPPFPHDNQCFPFFQAVQPKCTAAGTEYDPLTGNCETEQSNDGELLLNHALQVGRGGGS